jgi:DNA-binding transcriptional ArsR family regulator
MEPGFMEPAVELCDLARLLSSPARATMLAALLEGRALPAGELARGSGVASSTASEHLATLSASGLVTSLQSGRHRYYRLRGPEVGETLEAWFRLTPPPQPRSLRTSNDARRLAFARTCYDHLAGVVGVAVHEAMLERAWLVPTADGYDVAAPGELGLARLSVDVGAAREARRALARPCLDWTERRYHLAGALAGELCSALLAQGWVRRCAGRGLDLTPLGADGLAGVLGLGFTSPEARLPATALPVRPQQVRLTRPALRDAGH